MQIWSTEKDQELLSEVKGGRRHKSLFRPIARGANSRSANRGYGGGCVCATAAP